MQKIKLWSVESSGSTRKATAVTDIDTTETEQQLGGCPRIGLSPTLSKIRGTNHQESCRMAPRFKALSKGLLPESVVCDERVRPLAGGSRMFPVSGTVRATGHVGSGGPVQPPGSACLRAAPDHLDPDLRLQSRRVQFPADRAALPGRSQLHVHRREELPELPGVERFPEGPRGVLPGLLQADGAVGDGPGGW